MNVKTTFLHGDLEEEIYMKQTEQFVVKGKKECVCRLKKVFVWVKTVTKDVVSEIYTYLRGLGFTISKVDHYVYL